ncbi:RNA-binding protein 10 isoform X2 [Vanacampus margaritifer]
MWDGRGQGPRGRPPFRGNHREEMFGGRDQPMPGFWGRDGMNMGPMGHMGPLDLPPMDMRRMEGPPMWGRGMDPCDMRGRELDRDFFRSGPSPDLNFRGQCDSNFRDKMMNSPGFSGFDMGGRDVPTWGQNKRYMDMRDRAMFRDMSHFNNPNMDGRGGFPMDRMEKNDNFRDMRPPMGIDDKSRFNTDMPPQERRMMDIDRREGLPFNPRGGFESDMDFRARPGPLPEFRDRERSPLRFGNDAPPMDRAGMPADASGSQRSDFKGPDGQPRIDKDPESSDSPLMDYRSGEEMTLAEEWKSRQKDKPPLVDEGMEGASEPTYPAGFRRDATSRAPPAFVDRDRPPIDFPGKDVRFARGDHFAEMDRPPLGRNSPQKGTPPAPTPGRRNESNRWLAERKSQNKSNLGEKYHKNQPTHETIKPNDSFTGLKVTCSKEQTRDKMAQLEDFQSKDQDYRDIDYRTASGRMFEYKQGDLRGPPLVAESKPVMPPPFTASGSKDQDYRSVSLESKVSTTISITGIPKSATMEQILGAFTLQDGVPQPGMKMQNVVPGYSYDTAYVEFLNVEDAVHFMESNKGSLKVGTRTVSISYSHPDDSERSVNESHHTLPPPQESQLSTPDQPSEEFESNQNGSTPEGLAETLPPSQWQRNSDLTPEAWQQQVDQQFQQQESEMQEESWGNQNSPHSNSHQSKSVFKDSKTMIIKNIKPTTTIEAILKALDPFAYLDERNVRLIKAKTPGAKCFCFVDMDSHEQVTRLVDLLIAKPNSLYIDGVRVYAEVAKPLKNQGFKREFDKPNSSSPDYRLAGSTMEQQFYPQPQPFMQPPPGMQGGTGSGNPPLSVDANVSQGIDCDASQAVDPSHQATGAQATGAHVPGDAAAPASQSYDADTHDTSSYLYDATSGFYYDPETTLYYDPGSRYFYNAQNQEYLYWDAATKAYVPVPGGNPGHHPVVMTAEDQAILSNPAADAPLDMKKRLEPPLPSTQPPVSADIHESPFPEKKDDDDSLRRDEKPKSLAAVKIMKDMERWAKIQNRQKECVRSPSPVLKGGVDDDRKQSKTADAAFAVFERKNSGSEELFKKPLTPIKKDEKSKRLTGSLGMLASEYAAGSDEEVEEEKEDMARGGQVGKAAPVEREDKLTDWKKMACLLCRRQFPNKDALVRHQQLSDLHKQNMEIHLKIKRSKKELEALENQEKELGTMEVVKSPEQKKRKHHHQQPPPQQHQHQHQQQQHHPHHKKSWAGGSREMTKASDRPGLGSEPPPRRQKKEHVAWDHATYKQAVRKAMFARFKELE